MKHPDAEQTWERLSLLLEPFHEKALATARNLSRSSSDGDDLYQESVLRAYAKLHTLRDEGRFRSWFFSLLLSLHRSRARQAFWRRFLPLEESPEQVAGSVGEDGGALEEALLSARRVASALSRLPAVQREALVLHELEGFSMEEVAAMQRTSLAAVKSRVLRARARLSRHYRRIEGERFRRGESLGSALLAPLFSPPAQRPPRPGGRHE